MTIREAIILKLSSVQKKIGNFNYKKFIKYQFLCTRINYKDRAIKWYTKAAKSGDAFAQNRLGNLYCDKRCGGKNCETAKEWYKLAAEKGEIWAQYHLCYDSFHKTNDWNESRKYVDNILENCRQSKYKNRNKEIEKEISEIKSLVDSAYEKLTMYQSAAEEGDPEAQYNLASEYRSNHCATKEQQSESLLWFHKSAEQGNPLAQFECGKYHYYHKNFTEAVQWYQKVIQQKQPNIKKTEASLMLGRCYYYGEGIEKDYNKAVQLFLEINHFFCFDELYVKTCYLLGTCYENGLGTEKNYKRALEWYNKCWSHAPWYINDAEKRKIKERIEREEEKEKLINKTIQLKQSADAGNIKSQLELGKCYFNGTGVEKDLSEALKWYKKAAEMGDDDAQNLLGECYLLGNGVEKDEKEAIKWYRLSANNGNTNAKEHLNKLLANKNTNNRNLDKKDLLSQKHVEKSSNFVSPGILDNGFGPFCINTGDYVNDVKNRNEDIHGAGYISTIYAREEIEQSAFLTDSQKEEALKQLDPYRYD